jgi:hypothetical protein
MEGKVEEKLDPQASEGGGSHPKTDKHKKLAAMGHPKDKITHKDVLIARGVVAKEEVEELDELSKSTLGSYVKKRVKQVPQIEVGYQMAEPGREEKMYKKFKTKVNKGIGRAVDRLAKEEVDLDEDVEQLDELSPETHRSYQKKATKWLNRKGQPKPERGSPEARAVAAKNLGRMNTIEYSKEKEYEGEAKRRMAARKAMGEEIEEEVDQIITENNSFEIEIPAVPTYKDYLDAAMTFVDPEDALTVAEAFYKDQDESLIIESFTRSDIEQKVAVHLKAGNEVSMPKFGNKDGKPYAEYVVKNKEDGIRRKYIHHGTMRRVENMGAKGKKDAD